jgi:hypothetical protein
MFATLAWEAPGGGASWLAYLLYIAVAILPEFAYGDRYGVLIRSAAICAVVLPVMVPAAWLLLRRQKAPGPRAHP